MCKGDSLKDKEEISSEEERDIESTNYAKGKLVAKEEKVDNTIRSKESNSYPVHGGPLLGSKQLELPLSS